MRYVGEMMATVPIAMALCLPTTPRFAEAAAGDGKDGREQVSVTINDGNYQDTALYRSMTPTDDFTATPSFDYKIVTRPDHRIERRGAVIPGRAGGGQAGTAKSQGSKLKTRKAIPPGWNQPDRSS